MLITIDGMSMTWSELAQSLEDGVMTKDNVLNAFVECLKYDNEVESKDKGYRIFVPPKISVSFSTAKHSFGN